MTRKAPKVEPGDIVHASFSKRYPSLGETITVRVVIPIGERKHGKK